jgi:hypothetical protein
MKTVLVSLSIAMMLIGPAANMMGQTASATLTGVVVDPTGAAVADADISVINLDNGFARTLRSGGDGTFSVPDLPPGSYRVEVRHSGFAPASVPAALHIDDRLSLKVPMTVGRVEDEITVIDAAPLVQNDPAIGTLITRQFVENQPLNGRSFQSLVELSPGVVLTPTNVTQSGQFSVNGQRADTNYFTIDGVSANFGVNSSATLYQSSGGMLPAYSALGGTNNLVSVDALQEFRIQTSTYAPEFGRQPGGQVSILTRGGSKEFHGSVFEYLRNDVFDSNDYFANRNGLHKPALRQNDFGGVFGGPLARDRTFFFGSYEGLRLRQPLTSSPILVPTAAARQIATGSARDILNTFPMPNGAISTADPNVASFVSTYSDPSKLDAMSIRLDHLINSKWTVFGRYNYSPSEIRQRAIFATPNSVQTAISDTHTVTIGLTGLLSPRFNNDLRFNYSRNEAGSRYDVDSFGGATVPSAATFFPPFTNTGVATSSIGLGAATLTNGLNAANTQRQVNIVDTVAYSVGPHSLKFGFDYRRLSPINHGAYYRRFYTFNNVAAVLAGNINSFRLIGTSIDLYPEYNNYSAFAQDTWRAAPRFTLTYGLRYEVNPAPSEKNGNQPYTVKDVTATNLELAAPGTPLYKTAYGNFAPRAGVALDVFPQHGTVLRGGFGLFYDLGYSFTGSAYSTTNFPFANIIAQANVPLDSPATTAQIPPVSLNPPYGRVFAYAPGYKLPYSMEYNVTIEQRLGTSHVLSISYLGSTGRRLGRVASLRTPGVALGSSFTRIDAVSNDAISNYNALQLKLDRRFYKGLQALFSYTYSKSLDTVSDETIVNFQAPSARLDPHQDRGPSSFDVRHAMTAGLSYNLPSPKNDAARRIFGGFAFDTTIQARSSLPLNVLTGRDLFGLGFTTVSRPNVLPGVPLYIDDPSIAGGRRINRAAFSIPPNGVQGTLGRNVLRGFGVGQVDFSLRRQFKIREQLGLQFRVDAFNLFNHPNFATPTAVLTDPDSVFGVATQMLGRSLGSGGTSGGFSPLYQVGGPRSLQLALKLQF